MKKKAEKNIHELKKLYAKFKKAIKNRKKELKTNLSFKNRTLKEFIFCVLTPQSRAKACWKAVEEIFKKNVLYNKKEIARILKKKGVRFYKNKSGYITNNLFSFKQMEKYIKEEKDIIKLREYLVKNVKGYGYKEASHFLRNIGKGKDIAILDRHILKNLKLYGVIDEIPSVLSKGKYLEIESKMKSFSERIKIPMDELDFLLWAKEAGEVFK